MGTRSNIIVERQDGTWQSIYCHWDGYPEHNGRILQDHYNAQSKAEELVSLGDLSSLAEHCDKPEGHSFDVPVRGYCVYYGRDRGETECEAETKPSLHELWPFNSGVEYVYVWKFQRGWFVGDPDIGADSLVPVLDALEGSGNAPKPNIKAFGVNMVIGRRR